MNFPTSQTFFSRINVLRVSSLWPNGQGARLRILRFRVRIPVAIIFLFFLDALSVGRVVATFILVWVIFDASLVGRVVVTFILVWVIFGRVVPRKVVVTFISVWVIFGRVVRRTRRGDVYFGLGFPRLRAALGPTGS